MLPDWASSGGVKIERAKEHLRNLEAEITHFKDRRPYLAIPYDDPETGEQVYRAKVFQQPPPRWGAVAGDAIHNWRSSLDILWRRLMFPGGGGASNEHIRFGIYDSAEIFETHHGREVQGPRKAAVDIYKTLKPYKGGNDNLWLLAALDDADKHRLLIPVGIAISQLRVVLPIRPDRISRFPKAFLGFFRDIHPAQITYPLNDGTELFRVPATVKEQMNVEAQITFEVAFGEGEILKGEPILPTLNKFANLVDGIVEAFVAAG